MNSAGGLAVSTIVPVGAQATNIESTGAFGAYVLFHYNLAPLTNNLKEKIRSSRNGSVDEPSEKNDDGTVVSMDEIRVDEKSAVVPTMQ